MRMKWDRALKKPLAAGAICLVLAAQYVLAQNLGQNPQFNVAVQGQTGSQPEGAFLNFINWVGNVIAPVGAGGAVLGAIIAWLTGRGFGRWLFAAGALLAVSGVTRLIEYLDHERNRRCHLEKKSGNPRSERGRQPCVSKSGLPAANPAIEFIFSAKS